MRRKGGTPITSRGFGVKREIRESGLGGKSRSEGGRWGVGLRIANSAPFSVFHFVSKFSILGIPSQSNRCTRFSVECLALAALSFRAKVVKQTKWTNGSFSSRLIHPASTSLIYKSRTLFRSSLGTLFWDQPSWAGANFWSLGRPELIFVTTSSLIVWPWSDGPGLIHQRDGTRRKCLKTC